MNSISLMKVLNDYYKKGNISFAMPGHKNGKGIPEPDVYKRQGLRRPISEICLSFLVCWLG